MTVSEDSYQTGLPTASQTYPDQLQSNDGDSVYDLLGVDQQDRGHYWLQSEEEHSEIVRVDEDYRMQGRTWFASENNIDRYLEDQGWKRLSDYAAQYLD